MGLIADMREARFWKGWKDRFEANTDTYITPNNPTVVQATNKADSGSITDKDKAMDIWRYIYNNTEYSLSKEWKEPAQTLNEGIGDCEDVTFLAASMLPNLGVDNFKVVIGDMKFPSSKEELHTWVEVDGLVIDPTGKPDESPEVQYTPVQSYRIQTQ